MKGQFKEALNRELGVESEAELVPAGSITHATFKVKRAVRPIILRNRTRR